MKAIRIASFEQLMNTRYGADAPTPRRLVSTIDDLLGAHYGSSWTQDGADAVTPRPVAKAMMVDDGTELLVQPIQRRSEQMPRSGPFTTPPNDAPAAAGPPSQASPDEERARQERLLDLYGQPSPSAADGTTPADPPSTHRPEAAANGRPAASAGPAPAETVLPGTPAPPPTNLAPSAGAAPAQAPPPGPREKPSEDEFLADMKSILSGQKAYDPVSKSMMDRHKVQAPPEAREDPPAHPPSQPAPQIPPAGGGHGIFERIAQSMEYAGAYDLGPLELENRFAQFDRDAERRRPKTVIDGAADDVYRAPPSSPVPPVAPPTTAPIAASPPPEPWTAPDSQDMLAKRPHSPAAAPNISEEIFPDITGVPHAPAASQSLWTTHTSRLPSYAEPLYDTGEHVLAGGDLYPNQLMVGTPPSVAFSYGEIIAMADLFATVGDMMKASPAELTRLKEKIQQGAAHYRLKAGGPPNPGNEDWSAIIGERYMRLAEDNYSHFAPNLLFKDPAFAKSPGLKKDHKTTWEEYHLDALRAAQAMFLNPANQNKSYIPQWPLIINAFGDHFLTDAFAAGHVFNKEAIAATFIARFYTGGALNSAAIQFLKQLATRAFTGDLATRFSVLETYEPLKRWWNIVNWNPNINSASRFADLLIEIAKAEPDTIANLAVKALHDRLNREGLMVVNDALAKPWRLFGDEHLNTETLPIMQAAVRQSVANVLDPGIRVSNFDPQRYFARVWAHVPRLTPESEAHVRSLAPFYVDPSSETLLAAAAGLLTDEVKQLIDTLVDRKALKAA